MLSLLGALIGSGVELVSQMVSNAATGKDLLDLDYYDIAQSRIVQIKQQLSPPKLQ